MDLLPPDEKQQIDRIRTGERPDPEVLEAVVEESIDRKNQAGVVLTVHRRGGSWNRGKRVKKVRVDETVYLKCTRGNHAGDELNGLPSCAEFPAPEDEDPG